MNIDRVRQLMTHEQPYDDNDADIVAVRGHAYRVCRQFNREVLLHDTYHFDLLAALFHHAGEDLFIEPTFMCEVGCNISVGDHLFVNHDAVFMDGGVIDIGNNVEIGPKVGIYTINHSENPAEHNREILRARPVTIGDGVWIGGSATILGGVTIGDHVVIGAGSVVTHDVPAHTVVAGNPARVIRPTHEQPWLQG